MTDTATDLLNTNESVAKDTRGAKRSLETPEEKREGLREILVTQYAKDVMDKALDNVIDLGIKWIRSSGERRRKVGAEYSKQVTTVMCAFEMDTHYAMTLGFDEQFRLGAEELCNQIIRDYDCQNSVEKMLAETASAAFMRYMEASRRLNSCLDLNGVTKNLNAFMAMISKERDRAHRQFISTILTLKQLKAPTIEMNIVAKTAFVSQNQQINAGSPSNENNKPT